MDQSAEGMRMSSLFEDLYNQEPWLDVTIVSKLNSLTASKAAARPLDNCNTIWEIVNHMINWRENVLKRVNGEVLKTPKSNYFKEIMDTSDRAWIKTLEALQQSQQAWMLYLETITEDDLAKVYAPNQMNYYKHIHGILQHDAYHLGQIVLLLKFV